jgi:NADPH-dependent 2,4-dienoyl-CoA reductase/sulfur reductase-like enzyme
VLVIGGGWGGLAAARRLRQMAPEFEVTLIEREADFRSLPLSNAWLVGHAGEPMARQDYAMTAAALGYRYLRADAKVIDRERQRVHTTQGMFDYDWLIIAAGIRYDYAQWLGDDARAIEAVRRDFPAGYMAGELDPLKRKLAEFAGGDLLMTVPPGPARCPPAPYERAVMIAAWLKQRKIKGRLLLVDSGGGMQRFNRVFAEHYPDQLLHLTHATVKSIDPFRKTLDTEFDEIRFDDAIIIPPQGAADIVRQAGLIETDAGGRPGSWAAFDPLWLHAMGDPRIYLVGDLLGRASPLFGAFPRVRTWRCGWRALPPTGLSRARGAGSRSRRCRRASATFAPVSNRPRPCASRRAIACVATASSCRACARWKNASRAARTKPGRGGCTRRCWRRSRRGSAVDTAATRRPGFPRSY